MEITTISEAIKITAECATKVYALVIAFICNLHIIAIFAFFPNYLDKKMGDGHDLRKTLICAGVALAYGLAICFISYLSAYAIINNPSLWLSQ